MSEIKICAIRDDEAEKAAPILMPEIAEALGKGLPVTAFVAVEDEAAVGALAGLINGAIFDIFSIYVEPEKRRQGVGSALIAKLEELLYEEDAAIRVRYTVDDDDSETLLPFFDAMGFVEAQFPYPMYYMGYLGDLRPDSKLKDRNDENIVPFSEVSQSVLRAASNTFFNMGFPLPEGGLTSPNVDADLSFCVLKDDIPGAYVTTEDKEDGLIEISSLWSGLDNPVELLIMLTKLIRGLTDKYPPDTRIVLLALNEKSYKLMNHLFRYVTPCSYRLVKM